MAVSGCCCPQVTTLVQSIAAPYASMGQIGTDYAMQLTAHDSCCYSNCSAATRTRAITHWHTRTYTYTNEYTHSASQATWQRLRCQTRLGSFSITTNSLHHNDQKPCTHCRTLYSQRRALAHARTHERARAHSHTHTHTCARCAGSDAGFSVNFIHKCDVKNYQISQSVAGIEI